MVEKDVFYTIREAVARVINGLYLVERFAYSQVYCVQPSVFWLRSKCSIKVVSYRRVFSLQLRVSFIIKCFAFNQVFSVQPNVLRVVKCIVCSRMFCLHSNSLGIVNCFMLRIVERGALSSYLRILQIRLLHIIKCFLYR